MCIRDSFSTVLLAQEKLKEGFLMLESGNYEAAKVFFADTSLPESYARTAKICYGRALGLGGNAAAALSIFRELALAYPSDHEISLNLAEAMLWNEDYEEAIVTYQSLLDENPTSFVANYGMANANAAINNDELALRFMGRALSIQPDNEQAHIAKNSILLKRAYNLYKSGAAAKALSVLTTIDSVYIDIKKIENLKASINEATKSVVSFEHTRDIDSQDNESSSYGVNVNFMFTDRHRIAMSAGYRQLQDGEGATGTQQRMSFSDKVKLGKRIQLEAGLGLVGSTYGETKDTRVSSKIQFSGHLTDKLYTMAGYAYDNLDFNLALLDNRLLINKYSLTNNYMLSNRLGLYSRLQWQFQSDANRLSSQVFSLYYTFSKPEGIKLGTNASFQSYKFSSSAYFSPESYTHYEVFALLEKRTEKGWLYQLLGNIGQQKISDSPYQATYKIEAKMGYYFKCGLSLMTEVKYNNAVQVNTAGAYTYSLYGLNLSCTL